MTPTPSLLIPLAPGAREPLQEQIYRGLRDAILTGRLSPGARLPSTRALAADLVVARNTVVPVYEQLRAEGLIAGHAGGGTRVVAVLPDAFLRVAGAAGHRTGSRRDDASNGRRVRVAAPANGNGGSPSNAVESRRVVRVSAAAAAAAKTEMGVWREGGPRPFRLGVPDHDAFPAELWGSLLSRRWARSGRELLAAGDPRGYPPLREAIAEYVGAARAVRCTPEQVIVTGGAQPALSLAARALLDPGDTAWVEEPGYGAVKAAFLGVGARLVPVPVGPGGIRVDEGVRRAPHARLACVTPSNQHPLGGAMDLPTRIALLEWAERNDAWIVEDDYDSEFRYTGRPLPSLQGLDPSERVVYVGTFSKTISPALRLGFMVVPPALAPIVSALRSGTDRYPPALEQAVLADFIAQGHFARHVRRMRAIYSQRVTLFRAIAAQELTGLLEVPPVEAGLRLLGWLPEGVSDQCVRDEAARRGVDVEPLSVHRTEPGGRGGLLLGFAGFNGHATRRGMQELAAAIRACMG
ncbi:MAG TPA: PLP-dependent aminotransferase family protein [Longimicrobium sp.]|nr:PLP-dependent aminotransferase family protein [Longimicrobium sp.]